MTRIGIHDLHPQQRMRVLLTENCNASCPSCFNASFRTPAHMDLQDFRDLCRYLSRAGIKRLLLMGGEPTVHPRFEEAIACAQEYFDGLNIFTNAVNDRIKNIKLQDWDNITYNFNFIGEDFDREKFLPAEPGRRTLHIQIAAQADPVSVIKRLAKVFADIPVSKNKVTLALTLNCMENIFKNKNAIVPRWNRIAEFIEKDLNMCFDTDHLIPVCFLAGAEMTGTEGQKAVCHTTIAGVIDSRLNLRHCNMAGDRLLYLKKEGRFIPFSLLKSYLYKANQEKAFSNWSKICKHCSHFNTDCNGGCFMHNEDITREDVLSASHLSKEELTVQ